MARLSCVLLLSALALLALACAAAVSAAESESEAELLLSDAAEFDMSLEAAMGVEAEGRSAFELEASKHKLIRCQYVHIPLDHPLFGSCRDTSLGRVLEKNPHEQKNALCKMSCSSKDRDVQNCFVWDGGFTQRCGPDPKTGLKRCGQVMKGRWLNVHTAGLQSKCAQGPGCANCPGRKPYVDPVPSKIKRKKPTKKCTAAGPHRTICSEKYPCSVRPFPKSYRCDGITGDLRLHTTGLCQNGWCSVRPSSIAHLAAGCTSEFRATQKGRVWVQCSHLRHTDGKKKHGGKALMEVAAAASSELEAESELGAEAELEGESELEAGLEAESELDSELDAESEADAEADE